MTIKEVNHKLVDSRFKVFVGSEYERTTNFWGLAQLLADYADFGKYTTAEKNKYLSDLTKNGTARIDANISVKLIK